MKNMDKLVIVIPSLNTDEKLLNLVKDLKNLVIVNYGSKKESLEIFERIKISY